MIKARGASGASEGASEAGQGSASLTGRRGRSSQERNGEDPLRQEAWSQLSVLHLQEHLGELGHARGGFQMPEIRLHGTEGNRAGIPPPEDFCQGFDLRPVGEGRSGGGAFHVVDALRGSLGSGKGLPDGGGELAGVGGMKASSPPPVADPGTVHDPPEGLTPGPGLGSPPQQQSTAALSRKPAGGGRGKSPPGILRRRQGTVPFEKAQMIRVGDDVDSRHHRRIALPPAQAPGGQMKGRQGGGAGSVHRQARAAKIEDLRHPIRRVGSQGREPYGFPPAPGVRPNLLIVLPQEAHEYPHPRALAAKAPGGVAGAFEALPDRLQKDPDLRIEESRLLRGEMEEKAVEAVDGLQEPTHRRLLGDIRRSFRSGSPGRSSCPSKTVPAILRHRPETRAAVPEVLPQALRVPSFRIAPRQPHDGDLHRGFRWALRKLQVRSWILKVEEGKLPRPLQLEVRGPGHEGLEETVPYSEPQGLVEGFEGEAPDGAKAQPAGRLAHHQELAHIACLQSQEAKGLFSVKGFDGLQLAHQEDLEGRPLENPTVVDEVVPRRRSSFLSRRLSEELQSMFPGMVVVEPAAEAPYPAGLEMQIDLDSVGIPGGGVEKPGTVGAGSFPEQAQQALQALPGNRFR